jgi:hypothetical protein
VIHYPLLVSDWLACLIFFSVYQLNWAENTWSNSITKELDKVFFVFQTDKKSVLMPFQIDKLFFGKKD